MAARSQCLEAGADPHDLSLCVSPDVEADADFFMGMPIVVVDWMKDWMVCDHESARKMVEFGEEFPFPEHLG